MDITETIAEPASLSKIEYKQSASRGYIDFRHFQKSDDFLVTNITSSACDVMNCLMGNGVYCFPVM